MVDLGSVPYHGLLRVGRERKGAQSEDQPDGADGFWVVNESPSWLRLL